MLRRLTLKIIPEAGIERAPGRIIMAFLVLPDCNNFESDIRDVVEFYNLRGGKERIFDDMNNGFAWRRLPRSFMAENTVYLMMTALRRNFYKTIIKRIDVKVFGLSTTSRIRILVFKFISVPAKWIKTSRKCRLNIYTINLSNAKVFNVSD